MWLLSTFNARQGVGRGYINLMSHCKLLFDTIFPSQIVLCICTLRHFLTPYSLNKLLFLTSFFCTLWHLIPFKKNWFLTQFPLKNSFFDTIFPSFHKLLFWHQWCSLPQIALFFARFWQPIPQIAFLVIFQHIILNIPFPKLVLCALFTPNVTKVLTTTNFCDKLVC